MTQKINYWQDLEENVTYHIYNHAVGQDNLFITEDNYAYFLKQWKKYMPYLDVYAYCLMPNHFHFLAKVKPLDDFLWEQIRLQKTQKAEAFLQNAIPYHAYLEDQFKRFFSGYALAYNKQQGNRRGALFQKRFKRVAVTSEYRLLYMLAYVHHNPIRHGFTSNYLDWPHNSYHAFIKLQKSSSVNRDEVFSWFSDDKAKAISLFLKHHDEFKKDDNMRDFFF